MAGPTTTQTAAKSSAAPATTNSRHSAESAESRIAHTLTACTRCRQRKSKCDTGIPRCEPCERSNAKCAYYDPARDRTIPRTYIIQLRDKIRALEKELALEQPTRPEQSVAPDAENLIRSAARIRFKENDESRFLGPSSGIAMSRLVMEIAKQNTDTKSLKDVVTADEAQEIKDLFAQESQKPTSKVYPMISSVAEPQLPPRELTYRLLDLFMVKAQYMLPTLHEPSFRQDVEDVFNGSTDPCQNFQARLVIAISMQKLSSQYAGLADSYYLAALPFFQASIRRRDLATLQCYALMGQYSLLTPTRTAAYWVIGLAVKLCQDLGLNDEETITKSPEGYELNPLEIDMRRRLFWIITSMEWGLAHSLGRPSSFAVTHDHINVKFFEMVDDRYITPNGVVPGSHPIMKKALAIHFLKMRLLQAEIRRKLYLRKRESPLSDQDPWFSEILAKIDHWVKSCPQNDEGSGLSEAWFNGRRNTMIVGLYRPSPQIPEPSLYAAQRCYDASVFNVNMQRDSITAGSVDLTWIFTQSVFMALNTILWSLSYPEIRQQHPLEEVTGHIRTALEAIGLTADRWPGVESAMQLYRNLITGCLRAYNSDASFVVHSPSSGRSPSYPEATPSPLSSPSTATATSVRSVRTQRADDQYLSEKASHFPLTEMESPEHGGMGAHPELLGAAQQLFSTFDTYAVPLPAQPYPQKMEQSRYTPGSRGTAQVEPSFDPNSSFNMFPSVVSGLERWDPEYTTASTTASHLVYPDAFVDPLLWTATMGDNQYSQYFHQPYAQVPWRGRSLSQEEQSELMATLGDNIPDVSSHLVDESATFYNVAMP